MIATNRSLSILALISVLVVSAGAAPRSTNRESAKIIDVLKRSQLALAQADSECRDLAEYYPTLGKLVAAHDKMATRERSASCKPKVGVTGILSCEAQFSNDVPRERSEEEFTFRLEFEMKGHSILSLRCFVAG